MVVSRFFSATYILAVPVLILGLIQGLFALASFWIFNDHSYLEFTESAFLSAVFALLLRWFSSGYKTQTINAHAALLFTVLTWCVVSFAACLPFMFIEKMDITHAFFESVSALTTTGATVLEGLDRMPKSFLLYRQFLQWVGGLGVVIFVVAVLPMLNVGGMQLLKAETPGPMKDEKIAPRIAHSAQYLWSVYIWLTFLCFLGYMLVGMTPYDAMAHSFSTISTGGFSTHDASLGYFNSEYVDLVADVFMVAGAIAFPLHFYFYKKKNFGVYALDPESKVFILFILVLALLVYAVLTNSQSQDHAHNISTSVFHVISFITSTGYTTEALNGWPVTALFFFVVCGFIGGCAGSTAGGGKVIRFILIGKLVALQLKRLIHKHGAFAVKYKGAIVDDKIMSSTMAFFSLTLLVNLVSVLLVMTTGLDFWTSLSAVSTCQNVVGPAFGALGNNFLPASDAALWVFSFCMLLGRLEYFTILVIFSRHFWKS